MSYESLERQSRELHTQVARVRESAAQLRRRQEPGVAASPSLAQPISTISKLWDVGRPVLADGDLSTLAEQGYKRASLIHTCVTEFATTFAEPPIVATLGDSLLPPNDSLRTIAESPNRNTTSYEYNERVTTDLKTYGEAIVHLLRSKKGDMIRELWPLEVSEVEPIAGEFGVAHYEQRGTPKIMPRDIMHIKLPNPGNPLRGLSPIFVLLVEGSLDKDAVLYLGEFFRNGGIPSMVLTTQSATIPDHDKKRMRQDLAKDHGRGRGVPGGTEWSTPLFLSHGTTLQPLGIDPSKLDLAPIFDLAESRICGVMSVPAIIAQARIGLLQSQAYGTAREARRDWWGRSLIPWGTRLSQIHTARIAAEWGPGYRLHYDLSLVPAVLEAQSPVIRDTALLFNSDLVTRNQGLARLGMRPEPGGDAYKSELAAEAKAMTAQALLPADPNPLPVLVEEGAAA